MSKTNDEEREKGLKVSVEKKLGDLYELIDGIEIAMFTTRRPDGQLVSRPLATQRRTAGTDLWFVTDIETHKIDELLADPHVNVSYYKDRTREWVSVSGTALVTQDKQLIHGLYQADWRAWFGDEGGERDGGPDDPRIALILVEANKVMYGKKEKPMPLVLWELAKGIVTGTPPDIASVREVGAREIEKARQRPDLR